MRCSDRRNTTHSLFLAWEACGWNPFWDGTNLNKQKFRARWFRFIMQGTVYGSTSSVQCSVPNKASARPFQSVHFCHLALNGLFYILALSPLMMSIPVSLPISLHIPGRDGRALYTSQRHDGDLNMSCFLRLSKYIALAWYGSHCCRAVQKLVFKVILWRYPILLRWSRWFSAKGTLPCRFYSGGLSLDLTGFNAPYLL
jgi:hypothetical protein